MYIWFSQYMLIWYGNIQEETTWFLIRQMGGWETITLTLLFGHFLLPFFLLISRIPKRHPPVLAAIAGLVLLAHFVDIYWLVMPEYPMELVATVNSYAELGQLFETEAVAARYGMHWHVVDFICVLGMSGLFLGGTAWGLRRVPLIPQGDPRLAESLAFENY